MPRQLISGSNPDWSGSGVAALTPAEKAAYVTQPFVILDAALIRTTYGARACFLIQACYEAGATLTGSPGVLILAATVPREDAVSEAQEAFAEGDTIGPMTLEQVESKTAKVDADGRPYDPFYAFKPYSGGEASATLNALPVDASGVGSTS